ncbi:NUDIX hydrolase [Camelimonas abortus]|uniref:NUDIX hydrolase n=1 Tax=Camelimonas abortus TaxID=1017184 RepID=A0ABV7LG64_9HYPH
MTGTLQQEAPLSDQKMLDESERDEPVFPTIRPRNAATLIIIDRSGRWPKVLMGRRHEGHRFMPGKFVFPGGRIEANDRFMTPASDLHPVVDRKLLARTVRPAPSRGRALALAAIRETFEETGLLLGRRDAPPRRPPAGPWADFAAHGVTPDLEPLRFVARAITPPGRPKRFDTRFFAIDAAHVAARIDGVVTPDSELTELVWVEIEEARRLDLPSITTVVLKELEKRAGNGFGHDLPVPFYYARNGAFQREEL